MKSTQDKKQAIAKPEWKRMLAEEEAIIDFTEETLRRMAEVSVSKTELADKMGVEAAAVSRLLGGSNNFTLRTMVRIALALRSRLRFSLTPLKQQTTWKVSSSPDIIQTRGIIALKPMERAGYWSTTIQAASELGKTEEKQLAC